MTVRSIDLVNNKEAQKLPSHRMDGRMLYLGLASGTAMLALFSGLLMM